MLVPYNRYAGSNTNTLQDRVDLYLSKITKQPGHDSIQYDGVRLMAGVQNYFEHGLGREWVGFRIVNDDAGASVFADPSTTYDTALFLTLCCDIDCTVSIEVF